ncbi:MAG: twin-arginine translocase TatA/TatE family subunit [Actinomycetota bacterium]|nr:twin-arginine translocase TatA/TatE family subunit [Actinomycetota bacterium]
MLGLDNPIHILFLLALLLLVFGAKRLPEMGRSLGTGLRGFKETISGEDTHASPLPAGESQTPLTAAAPGLSSVPAAASSSANHNETDAPAA